MKMSIIFLLLNTFTEKIFEIVKKFTENRKYVVIFGCPQAKFELIEHPKKIFLTLK